MGFTETIEVTAADETLSATAQASTVVAAAPDAVFATLTNISGLPAWTAP